MPDDDLMTAQDALRVFLSSLLYRFIHVTKDAPDGFATFSAGADVRTPAEITRHMSGLILMCQKQLGVTDIAKLEPLDWQAERERFVQTVQAFDALLAAGATPAGTMTFARLWQAPLADAMTHVGQLATLRRLAGSPVSTVRYTQVDMPDVQDAVCL